MDCEIIRNVDVPSAYFGLRILLVDPDTTSLSNIAAILEEHSFKLIAIEQATIALSILREHIDQFDLVMVDANMLEMDYLEFIKSTQLIKDKPIISGPKNVLERMCVQDLTKECLTYRLKVSVYEKNIYDSRFSLNVQPVTSTNFNEEHHSNVLNSSNFSADVNELFQGTYIPQPLEVPLVALPSSNDYSLNECDEWINEFLELDDLS
ncbi:hypothetical protein R3W88_000916 [Solanum pinnatisectum]|uniref:Response regulatory domain-containing protein n=1 Tax=Solanum pinnatisectum TaxID=50273 RepID=A0AAV9MJG9_9SOLN|nr:hypothetical protein R3W88_000916 [Solanum pinnatisectum]